MGARQSRVRRHFRLRPRLRRPAVYGRTAIFDVEAEGAATPWRQRATTVNHVTHPADIRANSAMSVQLRHLEGRRLLYGIGQYGGGYSLFSFDGTHAQLAKPAGKVTAEGETWAWQVAAGGDIWHGDAPNRTIRRHAFLGWGPEGTPDSRRGNPSRGRGLRTSSWSAASTTTTPPTRST